LQWLVQGPNWAKLFKIEPQSRFPRRAAPSGGFGLPRIALSRSFDCKALLRKAFAFQTPPSRRPPSEQGYIPLVRAITETVNG
jgi:hypothetical protein